MFVQLKLLKKVFTCMDKSSLIIKLDIERTITDVISEYLTGGTIMIKVTDAAVAELKGHLEKEESAGKQLRLFFGGIG